MRVGTSNAFAYAAVAVAVAYVVYKLARAAGAVGEAARDAGGFLFGGGEQETLGAWIYGKTHPSLSPLKGVALDAEIKACQYALDRYGRVNTDACKGHLAAGHIKPKITASITGDVAWLTAATSTQPGFDLTR